MPMKLAIKVCRVKPYDYGQKPDITKVSLSLDSCHISLAHITIASVENYEDLERLTA